MSSVWAVFRIFRSVAKNSASSDRGAVLRAFRRSQAVQKRRAIQSYSIGSRRWQPHADLAKIAEEISQFITDNGSAEATIIAADET
jgi:hypothetical protein